MTAEPLIVDGSRPAVAWVASLPRSYRLTDGEWRVLMVLACDSYDGETSAPGLDNLAAWAYLFRSSAAAAVSRLCKPTEHRPALLAAESSRGRHRTVYRFLFGGVNEPSGGPSDDAGRLGVNKPSGQPSGEPSGQPSGEPSGHAGPSLPFPTRPPIPSGSVTSPRRGDGPLDPVEAELVDDGGDDFTPGSPWHTTGLSDDGGEDVWAT